MTCVTIFTGLLLAFVVWIIAKATNKKRVLKDPNSWGTPARGILLGVDVFSTRTFRSGVRVEQRKMRIDVEIPGHPPYEINARAAFPTNIVRDLIPGAAVELRVNPSARDDIYIIGLAVGFSAAGFLQAAPNQGRAPMLGASAR